MVLAIEPIFAAGPGRAIEAHDRWTVRTQTGCLAAHHEHTLVVGRGAPHILTA
jgi:methionyl aminopeptidase